MRLNKYYLNTLFLIFILGMGYAYNYHEILFSRPYSVHIWRQADCLSIISNYFKDNLSFLSPEVHWIGNKGHGRTISEFPIIYYSVAQLWKIFGQKEFLVRLINIILVFGGLFSLFKLSKQIVQDTFWSYFIPLFLFTSPILIFYTNNFLSNAPALGLALTGSYFYYLHYQQKKRKYLILSMIAFSFAGLIKLTSLIIFIAIFAVILLNGFRTIRKKGSIVSLLNRLAPFFIVFTIIFIWYSYAHYYNSLNHRNLFLQEIFPIWQLTPEKRQETFRLFYSNLVPAYFNKWILACLGGIFLSLFFVKKTDKRFHSILIITFIGMIIYFILFFRAFHVHDYYLINLLIFIPLLLIVLFDYLQRQQPKLLKSRILKGICFFILIILITHGAYTNRLKYDSKIDSPMSKFFITQNDKEYWDWVHWDYKNQKQAFETIESYLRTLGLKRTDRVLSMSDWSINITLYFMDQKGLTRYGFSHLNENERIDFAIQQGCKYLIISDKDLDKKNIDSKYLNKKLGKHKNISIFEL